MRACCTATQCCCQLSFSDGQATLKHSAAVPTSLSTHACILSQIFSSLRAAKKVIQEQQLRPLLLLNSEALEEFDGVDCTDPNAVVLGLAPEAFHYERLNDAFRLLLHQPEAPLIAVHKGRYLKVGCAECRRGQGSSGYSLQAAAAASTGCTTD
jgi:hypothetical protein